MKESRLQVRMETELLESVERFAVQAGVATNQLTRGVLRWLVDKGKAGMEPFRNVHGMVQERVQPGCVWVGTLGQSLSAEDRAWIADREGCEPNEAEDSKGEILFCLDFTERRVVRDDFAPELPKPSKAKPKRKR